MSARRDPDHDVVPADAATHAVVNAVAHAPLPEAAGRAIRLTSGQLFGSAAEVQIEHRGAIYRLKQTSLGKLILTK